MSTPKSTKPTDPQVVDAFIDRLDYPLVDVVKTLRQIILEADPLVGEEIKWNAPSFFYTGEMAPSNPKEYRRYIVNFNLFKADCVRLIFIRGATVVDPSGLLEGDYPDGRRLALFYSLDDVASKKAALQHAVQQCVVAIPLL